MAKDPELVRASEIGLWAYCHRAWWLARVQGVSHQNPQQLAHGTEMHAAHGARLARAQWLQRAGIGLMLVALVLVALLMLSRLWG